MHLIDIDHDQASSTISRAAAHLPAGTSLGVIFAVNDVGIIARDAGGSVVSYGVDDGGTWRVADLGDGLHEVTRWRDGVEVDRGVT